MDLIRRVVDILLVLGDNRKIQLTCKIAYRVLNLRITKSSAKLEYRLLGLFNKTGQVRVELEHVGVRL